MGKSKIFGLGILFCVFAVVPVTSAQDTLTVMTYNIYHGEQYYNRGHSNLKGIAKVINQVEPDLVAMQEVDSLTQRSGKLHDGHPINEVQQVAKLTGMYDYFGKAMDFDGGGYGEGVLSKKKLPAKRISLPNPRGGEPRAMMTVSYPLSNGKELIFGGTHLGHQFTQNRIAQVKKINHYFDGRNAITLLAGDFNFTPSDPPYKLISKKWIDVAKHFKKPDPTFSFKNPHERIDYLYLSKGNTNSWKLLSMQVLRGNNSDHMPIVATFVFK